MTSRRRLHLAAIAVLTTAAPSTRAQDGPPLDRTPVSCINISRVERMRIVDQQTVLFFLPGDRVYRNALHRTCPKLDRTDAIAYQLMPSHMARLCKSEVIRTERGVTCRLGPFEPITLDEAHELLTAHDSPSAGESR